MQRLTADTMRLLSPEAPVLARMENLRRATIYAAKDRRVAAELLAAVLGRVTTAATDSREPLAWFDAGYLIESYRQASHVYKWDMLSNTERTAWNHRSEPLGADGYAFVRKALQLAGPNPEMGFPDEGGANLGRASAARRGGRVSRVAPGKEPDEIGPKEGKKDENSPCAPTYPMKRLILRLRLRSLRTRLQRDRDTIGRGSHDNASHADDECATG